MAFRTGTSMCFPDPKIRDYGPWLGRLEVCNPTNVTLLLHAHAGLSRKCLSRPKSQVRYLLSRANSKLNSDP